MAEHTSNAMSAVIDVSPELLERWMKQGEAVLVDVREDFEHGTERIEGSHLFPLSHFDPKEIRELHGGTRVVFQCRSGKRSAKAASLYRNDDEQVFHLAGGIEAWKATGRGVKKSSAAPRVDVMRQVQIVAGSLVLLGVVLSATVSPWFLILSGFIGAGLTFAGVSGWCGMAMLLSKMPWNRYSPPACPTR